MNTTTLTAIKGIYGP